MLAKQVANEAHRVIDEYEINQGLFNESEGEPYISVPINLKHHFFDSANQYHDGRFLSINSKRFAFIPIHVRNEISNDITVCIPTPKGRVDTVIYSELNPQTAQMPLVD